MIRRFLGLGLLLAPALPAFPTLAPDTAAASAASAAEGFPTPACSLVPGWAPRDEVRRYDAETLFEYKNGAAEAYFAYGFVRMEGVSCQDAAGRELVIDVSELGDPDEAWGFFVANQDLDSPLAAIGSGGQLLPTSALLAKGRYYVEMAALPDGDHRAALGAFAQALLPRLTGDVHPPEAVAFFPREGLRPRSERLVPESVLGLRALREGLVAQYEAGRAFIVAEPSPEAASETLAKLRAHFAGARPAADLGDEALTAQDPYLDGVVVFRKGRYLAGVANAASMERGLALARTLAGRLPD